MRKPALIRSKFHEWDDFIAAVKKIQAAGITPISVGGKDKWPLHFYPAMLLMPVLGKEGLTDVCAGKNGGFHNPDAVKAFQLFKELAALQPFQKGFLAATYPDAAGTFHDGKTAFHLMGNWDLTEVAQILLMAKGCRTKKSAGFSSRKLKAAKGKPMISSLA